MTRAFVFKTKRWEHGLEIYIYEGGDEIGVTNTYNEYTILDAYRMAEDWIEASFGLTDDEYSIVYETGGPEAQ